MDYEIQSAVEYIYSSMDHEIQSAVESHLDMLFRPVVFFSKVKVELVHVVQIIAYILLDQRFE